MCRRVVTSHVQIRQGYIRVFSASKDSENVVVKGVDRALDVTLLQSYFFCTQSRVGYV